MNDPFELSPTIDHRRYTVEFIETMLRKEYEINAWEAQVDLRKLKMIPHSVSHVEYEAYFFANLRSIALALEKDLQRNIEDTRGDFAKFFSNQFRMLCFSGKPWNILMWSYYTDDHKGMVIGFEDSSPGFNLWDESFQLKVEYKEAKVTFDPNLEDPMEFQKDLFSVAKRKAKIWEHEEEIRLMVFKHQCNAMVIKNKTMDLYPIRRSHVRTVILGVRISQELKQNVLAELNKPEWSHVHIQEACLSPDSFELTPRTIRPAQNKFIPLSPR